MPKATQLVRGRAEMKTRALDQEFVLLAIILQALFRKGAREGPLLGKTYHNLFAEDGGYYEAFKKIVDIH